MLNVQLLYSPIIEATGCGKVEATSDTICTQMYFRTLFSSLVGTMVWTKAR